MEELKRAVLGELQAEFDRTYDPDFTSDKGESGLGYYTSFDIRSYPFRVGTVSVNDSHIRIWKYYDERETGILYAEFPLAQPNCMERTMQIIAQLLYKFCNEKAQTSLDRGARHFAQSLTDLGRSVYDRDPSLHAITPQQLRATDV
jgi:hypothetical protein